MRVCVALFAFVGLSSCNGDESNSVGRHRGAVGSGPDGSISDGGAADAPTGVELCPSGANIIVGTSGNDYLEGTSGADCILGLGGDDALYGLGGDDVIVGGSGNDYIHGGGGADTLYGDDGNDTLDGAAGDDFLYGGAGDDVIIGRNGIDLLEGGDGSDFLDIQARLSTRSGIRRSTRITSRVKFLVGRIQVNQQSRGEHPSRV